MSDRSRSHSRGRPPYDALRRHRRRQRIVVCRRAAPDHRADRPERRRQDHRVQLHHRLLQADRRHDAADPRRRQRNRAGAAERFPDLQAGEGRAHLPEHPSVPRHDRAGKPDGGPAQRADAGLGPDLSRPDRRAVLAQRREARDRAGEILADPDRAASTAPTTPPAICPTAISAASRSRARCAPSRRCFASTSRPPA